MTKGRSEVGQKLTQDNLTEMGFPVASMIKNPPVMQETQVKSLDQENPLEKGMAMHSGVLAWRISWTEEPGRLQSMGHKSQTQLSN